MGMWRSLAGGMKIEITSADIPGFLSAAGKEELLLLGIQYISPLTIRGRVNRSDYAKIEQMTMKRGESLRLLERSGAYWHIKSLLKRPVLWLGLLMFLLFAMFIPSRVYFINVEGNSRLPDKLILEKASACGIQFGASRSKIRSEKMKNALLEAMPELQWAGINTQGCVATISVREKNTSNKNVTGTGVSSIVAIRDGIITEVNAIRGNALCRKGQVVKAGDILISGYTDCGLSIQVTEAEGEVFAQTRRALTLVSADLSTVRQKETAVKTRYSIKIGKNFIKLYIDSGISDATCDKMYLEYYLTLPGGFGLPVALVKEQITSYDTVSRLQEPEDLALAARTYLMDSMVAGQILQEDTSLYDVPGLYCLDGIYTCYEMIGQVKNEEIILPNGRNNG